MRISILSFAFVLTFAVQANAQQLPNTNVYSFDIDRSSDSLFRFENPKYLTHFNADGYNNQPAFINNDEIYLTVQMVDDTTQTDIYSLNLRTMTKTQVTATPDSEYSPQIKPGGTDDGGGPLFSCVRVEADGKETQRIWEFPVNRSNNGEPSFKSITDIGYYLWFNYKKAAMFILGEPHRLAVADQSNERPMTITSNIGRCFKTMPNGSMAFVHKLGEKTWLLKSLDKGAKRPELITATITGKEDFAILSDGTFIMGNGSKLFKFHKSKDNSWVEIGDFKEYGIRDITRIAVRNNRLILVNKSERDK